MADNNVYSPIPARLHSVATEGVVSGADEIFDDAKGKRQSVINQETDAALDNKYDKDETYSKEELNNLITTPNQDYVTVDTYSSLPATGKADTVYRVSNYDGEQSQVDATKYSEYAWDGTQYVFLCVKSQIGEVFDITAYNSNTKYADLTAALGTNGANIPQSLRKGGMSVKFVKTSDNKYVQYRYMGTAVTGTPNPFLDTANWQGVDDEPTAASDNLVKSGGVAAALVANVYKNLVYQNGYYNTNGNIQSSDNWKHTQLIPIALYLKEVKLQGHSSVSTVAFFDAAGVFISGYTNAEGVETVPTIPFGTAYYSLSISNADSTAYFTLAEFENYYTKNDFSFKDLLSSDINWNPGYYKTNGAIQEPHSRFEYSQKFPLDTVKLEDVIMRGNPVVSTIAFFGEDPDTFISGVVVTNLDDYVVGVPEIPATAKYFALSRDTTSTNDIIRLRINVDRILPEEVEQIDVDDNTIGKTSENVIYVKDAGISESKLSSAVREKLNVAPTIVNNTINNTIEGDITVTGGNYLFIATDYINADGNTAGKENTVAEWQAMIDACAITGGTIFFPDGHYVCKPASGEIKYLTLKNGVTLKGSSVNSVTLELQTSDESTFFTLENGAKAEIDNVTIVSNLLNELITPNNLNLGKRVGVSILSSNVYLEMNNIHIKVINLNNGYDISTDNNQAASAAYMLLRIANGSNNKVVANNCYGESPAWGIFNGSVNSDLVWNGELRCWYKCTGIHGIGSRIIINGNLTSYGSGEYGCISCSGGTTIVNGNLYRIPEVDAAGSLLGMAVYAGYDDELSIVVNGNIFTCSRVYVGLRGACEITGNVYCIDKTFTTESNRTLFYVASATIGNNTYFADVKFTGNVICDGVKPFGLFDVRGGKLDINGNSFTSFASRIGNDANGVVKLCGQHKIVKDRFIRVYAGNIYISGKYEYSSNHEMFQLVAGASKNIRICNASFHKPSADYDRFGNNVTTQSGTGEALMYNHSAEAGTVIIVSNSITNGKFSEGVAFNAEIHDCAATQLGVATKSNTLVDL